MFRNINKTISTLLKDNPTLGEILLILIIGLVPLLWLSSPNTLVTGHDTGFPIGPVDWTEARVYTWSEALNWGSENIVSLGSIFIHLPEYILAKLNLDIFVNQKFVFIFWSSLIPLSMYCLLRFITKADPKYKILRISSSILYGINYYVLQAWFIAERTKFSIMIALPLVILFLFRAIRSKNYGRNSFYAALALSIFNGGGSVFTLYGGLFLVLLSLFICLKVFFKIKFKIILKLYFLFGIIFLILNLYWIVPQVLFSFGGYSEALNTFGGIESTVNWANEISKNASIINLLRLQGFPDWYDNPNHPYASDLLSNNFFQLISWLLPIFAFLSIFIYRKSKEFKGFSKFLGVTAILAIILTAGTHPPFGFIYEFLLRNIPLFISFRTPFYKFGYALWFSYAIMIGLTINYFANKDFLAIEIKYKLGELYKNLSIPWRQIILIVCLIVIAIYTLPYFQNSFFNFDNKYSTLVSPPDYIFEYRKWADENKNKGITLLVPELSAANQVDKYTWGYYSLLPIQNILSQKPVLSNSFGLISQKEEKKIIELIYSSLKENPEEFYKLANKYNITSILLREDAVNEEKINFGELTQTIAKLSEFKETHKWGAWTLYEKSSSQLIEPVMNIAEIKGEDNPSINTLQNILENINLDYFAYNPEIGMLDRYYILDTSTIKKINPNKNSIDFNLDNIELLDNSEIQIKRANAAYTNLTISIRRINNDYEIILKEPKITIDTGPKQIEIDGKTEKFTFNTDSKVLYIALNNSVFKVPENIGETFTTIGKMYTNNKDVINIYYYIDYPITLVDNKTFENTDWKNRISNCGGRSNNIKAETKTQGDNQFVSLYSDDSIACILQEVPSISPNEIINLKLSVKKDSGLAPSACLLEETDIGSSCIIDENFSSSDKDEWMNISKVQKLSNDTKKLILHLYAKSNETLSTTSSYDNLTITSYEPIKFGTLNIAKFSLETKVLKYKIDNINKLSIHIENAPNPINKIEYFSNNSFEYNDWGQSSICGQYKDELAQVKTDLSSDATSGKSSLKLRSNSGTACYFKTLNNFQGNKLYEFSIDYKNVAGRPGEICILQKGGLNKCLPEYLLDKSDQWQTKKWYMRPDENTLESILHLYTRSEGELSANLYDNLNINSVDYPFDFLAIFTEINNVNESIDINMVDKINLPSFKLLQVSNISGQTYFLTMKQRYSKDWIAIPFKNIDDLVQTVAKRILSGKDISYHFEVNYVLNGWQFNDNGDYYILIIHKYQIIYLISLIISIISLIIISLVIIAKFSFEIGKKIRSSVNRQTKLAKSLLASLDNFLVAQ